MKNRRWYVLGFEPETAGVEGWEVATNPLSFGGPHRRSPCLITQTDDSHKIIYRAPHLPMNQLLHFKSSWG